VKPNVQPVGSFVVRGGGCCPPGRYTLDVFGRWSGPCASTVALLDSAFRAHDHADAVSAASEQFGGELVRPVVALSA
jgi:hypothetical protein